MSVIDYTFDRARVTLTILAMIIIFGIQAYANIPKESDPDINIPIIYTSLSLEGISPEDAVRLLIRPMEEELQGIEGVKEMRSTAYEGGGSVTLEFDAGFNADQALADVREKVDIAKADLPTDAEEPRVNEVNISLFPIITVALSGNVPERTLVKLARDLQDRLEGISDVLEAKIVGDREEQVEIVVDPVKLEGYGIAADQAINLLQVSNRLIAAGSIESDQGKFAVKVPGLFENIKDIMDMPLKTNGDAVVRVRDIAEVRRTFKDSQGLARVNGKRSVTLEVSKRIGRNIIETIEQVKTTVAERQQLWPEDVQVSYLNDKSTVIRTMLKDLENNLLSAIILVMIVIVAALGLRGAALVGVAVPGSFLLAILVLFMMGITINIVVLFSLILSTGMLVDGAIVVSEYADRRMAQGFDKKTAYKEASKRMTWPIIASTATTLSAFFPLLFWPGIPGEFMSFMPITVSSILIASTFMALLFIPTIGGIIGKPNQLQDSPDEESIDFNIADYKGVTQRYIGILNTALNHPGKIIIATFALLVLINMAYAAFGRGVQFFPDIEPDFAQLHVHARGNLSLDEKDTLVSAVEKRILQMDEFKSVYTSVINGQNPGGKDIAEDVVGTIQLEFVDWQQRRPAEQILNDAVNRTNDIAGIKVEPVEERAGPSQGKPIQVQLSSYFPEKLPDAIHQVRQFVEAQNGTTSVEDTLPIPGIEWRLDVDRAQALKFGTNISAVGSLVRAVTNGLIVDEYRPDDSDEEVDIAIRFPQQYRTLEQLDRIKIQSPQGLIPVSNFTKRTAEPTVGRIYRVDGKFVHTVKADVKGDTLPYDKILEIIDWLKQNRLDESISIQFKGDDEEQQKSAAFLKKAFQVALVIMFIFLLMQFNSFYSSILVLTAVVLSTIGVFIGFLILDLPFSIIMGGVGIIALAGIVVNNNIILIDTFDVLKKQIPDQREALIRTGAQRLRPVFLTAFTTILGLLPMVTGIGIDFVNRDVAIGAPSMQWWKQLSSAIVFGLSFATILTLIVTPCALQLQINIREWWRNKRSQRHATE